MPQMWTLLPTHLLYPNICSRAPGAALVGGGGDSPWGLTPRALNSHAEQQDLR